MQTALCNVELQGSLTRGESVFDYSAPKDKHNVRVVTDMDMRVVMKLLDSAVT